jgi:hypothetical protein
MDQVSRVHSLYQVSREQSLKVSRGQSVDKVRRVQSLQVRRGQSVDQVSRGQSLDQVSRGQSESEYSVDGSNQTRGCMHRRIFIKKTWLSAFSYAQSRISLVFCRSLVFLFLGVLPLQLNQIWRILCVMNGEQKLYLTDMFECLCYI